MPFMFAVCHATARRIFSPRLASVAQWASPVTTRRRGLSPRLLLPGTIVLALVSRYLIIAGNGWAQDDNGYLVLAQKQGFGPHWLFSVDSTHWEPAARAIVSVQNHLMPF